MATWTCIHRPKARMQGHFIFRRKSDGAVSIADWSGPTPDTTDDGPLIVKPGTIVTVEYGKYGLSYSVPVWCERDEREGRVALVTLTMRALSKAEGLRLKVDYSESFKQLRDDVYFAGLLSPAYG